MKSLQERLMGSLARLPGTADELYDELRRILQQAIRAEVLQTPAFAVKNLLRQSRPTPSKTGGVLYAIAGGPKEFGRLGGDANPNDRFVRDDGAVIHFSLTVEEAPGEKTLSLYGYDFELYFPSQVPTGFVRFDLNKPGHANEDKGLRSHFHPSHEDLQVPSPVLVPAEALSFLLYRMRPSRDVPRS